MDVVAEYLRLGLRFDRLEEGFVDAFTGDPALRRELRPPGQLEEAVGALHSGLRDVVRAGYGLPEQETVEFVVVTDKPWSGFNYYLGNYRSRVAINSDLPQRLSHLPHLVAHESYP